MFDADELGIDPEDDEPEEFCARCGKPWEECECDDDGEDDDATVHF